MLVIAVLDLSFSFCHVKGTDMTGNILLLSARVVLREANPKRRAGILLDSVPASITELDAALCFYTHLQ